jgi:predicted dehydrogenase
MTKVRWGIISTAKIGTLQVIPGMMLSDCCEIVAISSRNLDSAQTAASKLGIPKAYGSYEELLADPDIDAIYNPLPNHMHVDWSIKALEAGKHVLCEKPLGLDAADARRLLDTEARYPELKVMEAFMYRFHPVWIRAKELARDGSIGQLRTIQSFFSYFNDDPNNIRNKVDIGGGGLMDIGCYCISLARFVFEKEPIRVLGIIDRDPDMKVDRITTGVMDFGDVTSSFTCGTQLAPYQRVQIVGTEGRVEIEIPFNIPPDRETRIWVHKAGTTEEITFPVCDKYTCQGEVFSRSILENTPVPTPLRDAIHNMETIDAIFESAENSSWVSL